MVDEARASGLVNRVNCISGYELEFVGVAAEGVSGGAVFVRWPDGRPGVITYADPPIERVRLTAEVLDLAKARGLPVPTYEFVGEFGDGRIVVVQERLPGDPIGRVDVPLIDDLIALNDRFAGLLTGRTDVPGPQLCLRRSGPDHPRHEALAGHDDRTRRMLARIKAVGESVPDELTGDDLVHPDFARGNVLVDGDGRISGVVDWSSGALRGNRAFALVSLRSDLEWRNYYGNTEWAPQSAVDRLDDVLRTTIEPAVLAACRAHWTLHKAYATILGGADKELDLWLTLGEARLP